ncbi:DUF3098 domain-containing protein [Porphyromonas circumdentaria]|uniref:DUF3098 domain-containing protein n=1 Tax=Porphyromonas circumdentaria TaxID=29524 RepID=A0A1T4NF38_9PORP|nr:DUF3098 domain-containing protein [Porphyromonas circumdentaria]MBB6275659.1 drug/metabolite transporter (DMT)-like permease [Porphyromonas circumdentaria]SJZ77686.1 Protein of unknown function [Porphyromonas circumdentaria]
MIFGKKNYILIIASLLLIIFGIILMSGGGSVDGVSFNPDIFSVRRIVIAPIISLLGFLLMIVAIMLPDKNRKGDQE